jgi:hypothetical protein
LFLDNPELADEIEAKVKEKAFAGTFTGKVEMGE